MKKEEMGVEFDKQGIVNFFDSLLKEKEKNDKTEEERSKYWKFVRNYSCQDNSEKHIHIFNALYWSVMKHKNMSVPLSVTAKDVYSVWNCAIMLMRGKQLGWLKEHSVLRIIFRKGSKKYVEEIDVSQ